LHTRYFFDLFLPSRYERRIYLDADIRVLGDISPLFNLDLGPHAFAASPDVAFAAYDGSNGNWIADYIPKIEWDTAVRYANAGVLLIDRARWQQLDLSRRVIEHLRTHLDICFLAD
jgi:lipopolysaccharide biosynthesis glycosyltransferase